MLSLMGFMVNAGSDDTNGKLAVDNFLNESLKLNAAFQSDPLLPIVTYIQQKKSSWKQRRCQNFYEEVFLTILGTSYNIF